MARKTTPCGKMVTLAPIRKSAVISGMANHFRNIVRVHYFVRGGSVGHRSRASSKHLSPHLPVDQLDSSGVKKGCLAPANARVVVGSTKKPTRCCCFREVTLQHSCP
ncbi:hypothetical protein TNCV_3742581 [Trichonephila clavipes]|nr:hypothetical protein TNCV_3742581 [Trichonephila clavipes]